MRIQYVNVYAISLGRGGAEEGGWWYDIGEPVKTIPVLPEKAERLSRKVAAWCERENEGSPSYTSVIGTPDLVCMVQDHPAQGFPDAKPVYE